MEFVIEIVNLIGIYIILALALNVICGMTGLLQLGHAGFFAVGAYTAGLVSIYCHAPNWGYGNFVVTAVAAMVAAALFALAIGIPCLRLRGDYLAIATLGFGEIVKICLNNIAFPKTEQMIQDEAALLQLDAEQIAPTFGEATGIQLPATADYVHTNRVNPMAEGWGSGLFDRLQGNPFESAFLAGLYEFMMNTWFVWLFVIITFVLLYNLKRSAVGRAFLAIREDEIAARSMGVNLPAYKILSFLLSAAFAGLAGALYIQVTRRVSPAEFTLLQTIQVLLIVVLGGLGSFSGSVLAAVVIVGVPELMRFLPTIPIGEHGFNLAEKKELLFAVLLIFLVRVASNGIMGMKEFPDLLKPLRQPEKDNG